MIELNVTTQEAAACMRILTDARGPITAADLAVRLGIGGNRETQRRRVREIIFSLRHEFEYRIVAFNPEGYWLVRTEEEWIEYNKNRENYAKRIIGQASKRIKMATDSKGQGLLFVKS